MKPRRYFSLCILTALFVVPAALAVESSNLLEEISKQQAALYERVGPTVVLIETIKSSPEAPQLENQQAMPFMFPFDPEGKTPFRFDFRQIQPDQDPQEGDSGESRPMVFGLGSGVIVRADSTGAWILTNTHVLGGGAEQVNLQFRDQIPIKELDLKSNAEDADRNVFLDPKSDLALIRLTSEQVGDRNLVAATFGDSDAIQVGELVFTLGAPLSREQSFSQGIISAKDRSNVFPGYDSQKEIRYEGLIQTTAFINQGDSGGPLLDIHGNVVGINVAIQTAGGFSRGFVGIGFAIPANRALGVMNQLMEHGKVVRGWLGVGIEPPTVDEAVYFNLPAGTGVRLSKIYEDTPAAKGGLEAGDILLKFNGTEIRNPNHLQNLVAAAPVGRAAKIEVLRGGETVILDVVIGEQPEQPDTTVASSGGTASKGSSLGELGASVRDLDDEEKQYFDSHRLAGVLVEEVDPKGPLADKQIEKGALITKIERQPVASVEELEETIAALKSGSIPSRNGLVMIHYVPGGGDVGEERFAVVKLDF